MCTQGVVALVALPPLLDGLQLRGQRISTLSDRSQEVVHGLLQREDVRLGRTIDRGGDLVQQGLEVCGFGSLFAIEGGTGVPKASREGAGVHAYSVPLEARKASTQPSRRLRVMVIVSSSRSASRSSPARPSSRSIQL